MARRVVGQTGQLDRRAIIATAALLPVLGSCRKYAQQPVNTKVEAEPDQAEGDPGDLVELVTLDPTIKLDIRYATPQNFTGRVLYGAPRAFLIRVAAHALVRAHRRAAADGYGLTIFDGYRPWRVTKQLWDATPPGPKRNYVANPKKGSRHNRGCAVDLSLHDRQTGTLVPMPSDYDEFTPRAHRDYAGASAIAIANRERLTSYMQAEGFRGMSNEWWHFDFYGWENYPILDIAISEIGQK